MEIFHNFCFGAEGGRQKKKDCVLRELSYKIFSMFFFAILLTNRSTNRRVARNSQWGGCFGGLGAEPPALENLAFFCKNNLILELF